MEDVWSTSTQLFPKEWQELQENKAQIGAGMEKIDAECWDSWFPVGSGLSSFTSNFLECLVPLAVFG